MFIFRLINGHVVSERFDLQMVSEGRAKYTSATLWHRSDNEI